MQRNRFVAAVVTVACVIAGVLVPQAAFAHASTSSIARVAYDRLYTKDPHFVVITLRSFDAAGRPVPFRGSIRLDDRGGLFRPSSVEATTQPAAARPNRPLQVPIASATGREATVRIDVGRLRPSVAGLAISWSLVRRGESAARAETPTNLPLIPLVRATAQDAKQLPVRAGDTIVQPLGMQVFGIFASAWPCESRELTFGFGTCVVDDQLAGARIAGTRDRMTFHWEPLLKANGRPYRRCLLLPEARPTATAASVAADPEAQFDDALVGSSGPRNAPLDPEDLIPGVDVPGDWTTYTVPVGEVPNLHAVFQVRPGETRRPWVLSCYDSTQDVQTTRAQSDVVPDVSPTRPRTAVAHAHGATIQIGASGSRAAGVAPVLGYTAVVHDRAGRVVARADLRTREGGHPATVVRGLAPGRYRVVVRAVNEVGSSAARTTEVVVR